MIAPTASAVSPLLPGDVHLWAARLSSPDGDDAALLSPEEEIRAARYRFPADRARFTASRAILRRLLARYSGIAPEAIEFTIGTHGKPSLRQVPHAPHSIRFNLSHSGEMLLIAITCGPEVGVDIEQIRDDFAIENLAAEWLPPEEVTAIHCAPAPKRSRLFFQGWTRLEARLKASGAGLAAEDTGSRGNSRWTVIDLTLPSQYAGALAIGADRFTLHPTQWLN